MSVIHYLYVRCGVVYSDSGLNFRDLAQQKRMLIEGI